MTAAEVAARITGSRRSGGGYRAPAPCHGSRGLTLAIRDGRDGRTLLYCHAGCDYERVLRSLGLTPEALSTSRASASAQPVANRSRLEYARAKPDARRDLLVVYLRREAERRRVARIAHNPYESPNLRSADVNAARLSASSLYGIALTSIARYSWEGYAPHDCDPDWPMLFARALDEIAWERHHYANPNAPGWESSSISVALVPLAAERAAIWIHAEAMA